MHKKNLCHSEHELVILLKNNNKKAFEYLYDHYAPALYTITCKIVKDKNLAADVIQESFIKIWKNIAFYNTEKGTLFTWVLNITRHTAIDRLRENYKFKNNVQWDSVLETDLSARYVFNPTIAILDLRSIVDSLLPEKKLLIQMVYFEGFTHEEASDYLKLPLGTVKSRIRKTLQELRRTFDISNSSPQLAQIQLLDC